MIHSLAILLGALQFFGPPLEASPSANAEVGHRIAAERCGSCHAIGPKGASRMRSAPAFRGLHKRYPVEGLAEALAEGISVGSPVMREHVLEPKEVADLIAYLKSLEPAPK